MKIRKRIILVLVILIALVISGGIFMITATKKAEKQPELMKPNQEKPIVSKEETVQVDWMDYTVYEVKEVDFRFIIAKIKVKSTTSIHLPLSNFITSENIQLDAVERYVAQLEKNNLYLGKQNVWFSIISTDTTCEASIFIPVIDKNLTEISVTNRLNNEKKSFSLKNPKGTSENLWYKANDVVSDGKTFQMVVSQAVNCTGDPFEQNGSEMNFPSTVQVYSMRIKVVSLWGDSIIIDEASYIPDEKGEVMMALDNSIQSLKFKNIIGVTIKEEDVGDLFFIAYQPHESSVVYKGIVRLKIRGKAETIDVRVNLN